MKEIKYRRKKSQVLPEEPLNIEEPIETEEELPIVKPEEIGKYLVDNLEGEGRLDKQYEEEIEEEENEVPIEITKEEIPDFATVQDALNWAVENNKVVRINYVTRKGIDLTRLVEPQALFFATGTGNQIVVTYDRSVRNIRAFIVSNILNYIFTGKEFKKRLRVLPATTKRKIAMENKIFGDLKKIGDELQKVGLEKSATIVTNTMNNLLKIKIAQYVGIQGYWLRNGRCWKNCYRHKRAEDPKKGAQSVWMECWKEYLASINDDTSGWEKYASEEKKIKSSTKFSKEIKLAKKNFVENIDKKFKNGLSKGEAIFAVIKEEVEKPFKSLLTESNDLLDLSKILYDNGHKELGEKLATISLKILKEAQFGGTWWQKGVNFFRSPEGQVAKRIKYLIQRINQIMRMIQGGTRRWSSKEKIIKSQVSPGQSQLLKTVTDEYQKFVSDVREEIAILNEMSIKNPKVTPLVNNVLIAMRNFLVENNKAFSREGGFSGRVIMNNLGTLLQSATGAQENISQDLGTETPSEQINRAPVENSGGQSPKIPQEMAAMTSSNLIDISKLNELSAPVLMEIRNKINQALSLIEQTRIKGRFGPKK